MAKVPSAPSEHDRRTRVLFCAVDPEHQGSVAGYPGALRPQFSNGIDWFALGSRRAHRSHAVAPLRALRDTARRATDRSGVHLSGGGG
jgi:hypothetical protein